MTVPSHESACNSVMGVPQLTVRFPNSQLRLEPTPSKKGTAFGLFFSRISPAAVRPRDSFRTRTGCRRSNIFVGDIAGIVAAHRLIRGDAMRMSLLHANSKSEKQWLPARPLFELHDTGLSPQHKRHASMGWHCEIESTQPP